MALHRGRLASVRLESGGWAGSGARMRPAGRQRPARACEHGSRAAPAAKHGKCTRGAHRSRGCASSTVCSTQTLAYTHA